MPPPTEYSSARLTSPSSMIDAFAVVPPMSKEIAFEMPIWRVKACTPITPAAGPEFDDVHRQLGCDLGRRQTAVRLHQQQRRINVDAPELPLKAVEVFLDDRPYVGIDYGRRGALVLLDLGQHLRADAERDRRRDFRNGCLNHLLVHGIGIRVQQADGDRLDALPHQFLDGAGDLRPSERTLDLSLGVDALVNLDTQIALDELRRLGPGDVIEARHPERTDL